MGPRKLAAATLVLLALSRFPNAAVPFITSPFCRVWLDPHDKFTRVVPRRATRTAALTADERLSAISVHYGAGFPGPAQVAFQAAVDIWQTQVQTPIGVVIDANWVDFGNTLLLGQAGATCAFRDFPGAIRPSTWFVAALAERLANASLSGGCPSPDQIAASFNSTANWYFGTDGVPASGMVDFESVVLHEFGHGLGFIGTANVSNGLGTVGDQGFPYIYDANVADSAGTSILNGAVYPNGSVAMASLLQGSGVSGAGLFWSGAGAAASNGGSRPVLYAPGSFQNGSSYSHLDETTYPAGDLNSLMTPAIGFAEVIHTPGAIALGMFTDMGWGNQTGANCSFGLDHYTANVPASGGPVRVQLITASGCAWTASSAAPFVSGVTPASGTNSAIVQMSVAANAGSSARAGTVTIGTETLTIAQQGTSACGFSLASPGATVSAFAQNGSVALTTTSGCAWTAFSSDPTVASIATDPPSGQDSATIAYAVSGNTGPSARTATLTIGGQPYSITQAACGYAVDNNLFTVSGAANTVTVNVSTAPTCQWTATSGAPFITFISGAVGTGPGAVQLSIAPNPTTSPRSGNATIAGQTVTISQTAGLPTMTLDRASLNFGATLSGTSFAAQTDAQAVRMTQAGLPGTVTWTAASNQPWLTVAPLSGTGSAVFSVGVKFDPSLPPSADDLQGSIAITFTGANSSGAAIAVNLALILPAQSTASFGAFDTPLDGATGLAGSIALTGWALDDVQVARVTICRDAVAGEAIAPNGACGGLPQIFIGDGIFVDGARPDVAAAYPAAPMNTRGGWGYLLLTNLLPFGGNGSFRLSSYAYDLDRHVSPLGSKNVACNNAASVAPFGAIDTPGQGDVVGGIVDNFGWVLSAGQRRADPPGGGTVTVFVDGAPAGSPGGWTSRSDLSALFPVSSYAGVDTALGVFGLDTTSLTNGVHTISWSVTDNFGVTSGIGSRFFTVSNGSSLIAAPPVAQASRPAPDGGPDQLRQGYSRLAGGSAEAEGLRYVPGRRGFDLDTPLDYYFADANGVVTIEARELDRIELQLGQGATGALITAQGERPLPIGARIDPATGLFTWAPGPGYIGRYEFVLGAHRVRIVLHPR